MARSYTPCTCPLRIKLNSQHMADGIYLPDGSFRSREKIISDSYERGEVVQRTPLAEPFDYDRYHEMAVRRRDEKLEREGYPSEIDLEIPTDTPIVVGFLGDTHLGGRYLDYEMLKRHIDILGEHPLFYTALMGDLREGFFFNPAQNEQVLDFDEQFGMTMAMIERIKRGLLFSLKGQHDVWEGKMGTDIYRNIIDQFGKHVLQGTSIVNLKVGDIPYRLIVSHNFPGFSIYNRTHSPNRTAKMHMQGGDLYVQGDSHQKGVAQQHMNDVEGGRLQTYVTTGPYKYGDEYARKLGHAQQREKELGAVWVRFDPHERLLTPFWSSREAVGSVARYLT